MNKLDLSISIVSYNNYNDVEKLIKNIDEYTSINCNNKLN